MSCSLNVPRANMVNEPRDLHPQALTVRCQHTGMVGQVVGLTSEKRPIVDFQGAEPQQVLTRSRGWDSLTFGEGRAW